MAPRLLKSLPYTLIFLFFFIPPIDPDLGWHLRYGDYFLTNFNILKENSLTYFMADYPWAHPNTLYQILISTVFKFSGLLGLSTFYGFFMCFFYFLLTKFNQKLPLASFVLILPIFFVSFSTLALGIRSQIFTILFTLITIVILLYSKTKPQLTLLLPFIMLLWANIHGGFFLGLVLMLFFLLSNLASRLRNYLIFVLPISVVTTLINPYGISIYQWTLRHSQVPLKNLIGEWVPPSPFITISILIISSLIFFYHVKGVVNSKKNNVLFWLLTLPFFSFLAFSANRNVPLWSLIATLSLIDLLKEYLHSLETKRWFKTVVFALISTLIIPLAILRTDTVKTDTNLGAYCQKTVIILPCQAVSFLKENNIAGKNIFNTYEWGGFLEWQSPENKYFVDGRMPAWPTKEDPISQGKSPYTIYLEVIQAKNGYSDLLKSYKTDLLFFQVNTFLDIELRDKTAGEWKEIYRDKVAVIYERR